MSEIVPLLREFLTKEQLAAELGRNPRTLDGTRLARGHHGPSWAAKCFIGKPVCQSASDRDPRSASKRDPFVLRFERLALAPSELVGVAETVRARVVM